MNRDFNQRNEYSMSWVGRLGYTCFIGHKEYVLCLLWALVVLAWSIWHRMAGSCWPSQDLAVIMAKLSACDADMIVIQMLYRLTQTLAERWKASRCFSLLGVPPYSPNKLVNTWLLYITFLFRALARLQPPAGLIETAMERERERDIYYIIWQYI